MKNWKQNEFLFQVVLHMVVFVFYAYEKRAPHFQPYQFAYFANFALLAGIINYVILPWYHRNKSFWIFALGFVFVILIGMVIEEMVLEKIFFPTDRGQLFNPFVLFNVVPVVAILVGFKFGWDALHHKRELEELKDMIRQNELQFLNNQINPHFLFNNLNNLYAYALEQSPKTPEIILELSGVLRYMLYDCRVERVPLENEMKQLENFVNLNEMQIEERGKVNIDFSGDSKSYKIAPLILMVFVENAFKHSQATQSEDIWINIKGTVDTQGIFKFVCENNFVEGPSSEALASGIGLDNVKRRLALIYPKRHDLEINQEKNIFKVELTIQLDG